MKTNIKKLISAFLVVSTFAVSYLPAMAIVTESASGKEPAAESNSQKMAETVNLAFWQGFNDELLEGYITRALDENQDLKIATLRVEEARQNAKMQLANELPNLQIGASPIGYKLPGGTSTAGSFSIPMIVNYEADIFLKNHDKTKSVKKLHEVAQFNERAVYLAVSSEIGATYFNIVKLDKLISLQEEIIKDRKIIYELMKVRNDYGLTSTADKVRAEKSYVLAVSDMSDLKKAREILLNSFAVMIGDSANNTQEYKRTSYENLTDLKAIPTEVMTEVITQRPDYLAAEKMVEKAGIDVRVAKKEFLPSINLIGLLSLNSFSGSGGSMGWANSLGLVGGAAMLPLFTGGRRVATLKLMKNKYEQVLQNYQKTNLTAIKEVNNALVSLKLDNEKYKQNLNAFDMQKQDYDYMSIRYNDGLISNLDLIQQKEVLLSLEKMIVSSKTDCYVNEISLYKAVGGKI